MQIKFGTVGRLAAVLALVALTACETRTPPSYSYVPPPPARGPNSPYPVPEPRDKPQPDMPITTGALAKPGVVSSSLDDVPGGGTQAPPPRPPSYAGRRAPATPAVPVKPRAGEKIVVVQRGDTVFAIARREGVNPREIIELNGLQPPYLLNIGQRLRIPAGEHHSVVPGDTLYSISRRYGVDIRALMQANNIDDSYGIVVGQLLVIPPPSGGSLEPATSVAAVVPASAGPPARTPPQQLPDGFIWPAKGQIISSFGPKKDGLHNDGVNIRVPRGTEVRAVAAGTVVYAGNDLKGFGNLVLVRHAGDWISAYAHNDDFLVTRGQIVQKGEVIARAGSSGAVTTPQIHFELRRGTRAVDPRDYLPPV
ncbi:MAG: LysM peptidoglycan-binding domain-containing protein [Alphaproteobacteria bacterium]|nr:LysM peptidoglycan-binding domain-containing protein [Alphaproteobacteria bacterium]